MSRTGFFLAERQHFFRPLTNKRRELVVACLRTLHERLHGPSADYSRSLDRDGLKELLLPVVQTHINASLPMPDEMAASAVQSALDSSDPPSLTSALIREFLKDGWLETFSDRAGLVTAYRFTRAGKLFSEALWAIDRPRARTRQRNMRSCRNALDAAASPEGDAYDLIDAYEFAENVISDLAEGVDYFQELVRRLMQEASRTPWDQFLEFLDRFEREFKKQLTADNAERHRQNIRESLTRLRCVEDVRSRSFELQLVDIARWAAQEKPAASSTFDWLLDRIEEMVEVACDTKQPELIKAMNVYMRRAASIVQQAMMLRAGATRHSYSAAIALVATAEGDDQDRLLEHLGAAISPGAVRLLDPASFRLRNQSQRRKALTLTRRPVVTRESRLSALLARAEANAFSVSNDDVLALLRTELRRAKGPVRLSALPMETALQVLHAMQAVEAVRSQHGSTLRATRLPARIDNEFYSGCDYLIEVKEDAH